MDWPWTQTRRLKRQVADLQHTVDSILTGPSSATATEGNPYPTYAAQVAEASKKYQGTADWGVVPLRNIVDLRAAFIIGNGIDPVVKSEAKGGGDRELEFIRAFMERNNLDEEVPQDWAREAEIEGRILLRLFPDTKDRQIDVRFVPYTQHSYTVKAVDDDYAKYTKAEYRIGKSGKEVKLDPPEFVYARFGGRTHMVNETPSKVCSVLRQIESLDRALNDWRKANRLFGAPTPYFKTESASDADNLLSKLRAITWKIGTLLVSNADYSLVGPDTAGMESIKAEIVTNAQIISGATGIPVHFLGFPELMSNRSTAENLFEVVGASTNRERSVWVGAYEELFAKVLGMANAQLQTGFDTATIGAQLPEASASKLKELTEVWLPLQQSGAISLATLMGHIPGVDAEAELALLQEEQEKATADALAAFKAQPAAPGSENDEEGQEK